MSANSNSSEDSDAGERSPAPLISTVSFDLPGGWRCNLVLRQVKGAVEGGAELLEGTVPRCLFVMPQLPSREAMVERVKSKSENFILDWAARTRSGTVPFSL